MATEMLNEILKNLPCTEDGRIIGADMYAPADLAGPRGEDGMRVLMEKQVKESCVSISVECLRFIGEYLCLIDIKNRAERKNGNIAITTGGRVFVYSDSEKRWIRIK